ncbi:MAG: lysozyme [Acidobacteriota bacterium]|nr:lysozyme [Acidobacteriota bacterium]
MHLSAEGLKLLMNAEGFRRRTYRDQAGLETIGYGHRILPGEAFPNALTDDEAAELLDHDVTLAEESIRRLVAVPLTQGQFDALVDFVFNLGASRLAQSTLLKELNAGRYAEAAAQLPLWDHAGGRELPGLKLRRAEEVALWNSPPTRAEEAA